MPKPTLALKATVTRRTADPVPSDLAERLAQLQHHEAVATVGNTAALRQEETSATVRTAPKATPHVVQNDFLKAHLGKPVVVYTLTGVKLVGKLW